VVTHVVFDFDGTLAASMGVALRLYNELAARYGYGTLHAGNIEELRHLSILERCKRLGVPAYKLPGLMLEVSRSFRQAMHTIDFNEGIPELLGVLRARGLKVMILSSNAEENIRAFLQRHGAEAWVEDIYCSSRIFGKARLLRTLMKRAGLQPEQLVYVGDEHRDIEACKEVGVRVIAVLWGVDPEARLREAGPDSLARHPAEVAEWVARSASSQPG
jgi:phosphoglycolate phosphatase